MWQLLASISLFTNCSLYSSILPRSNLVFLSKTIQLVQASFVTRGLQPQLRSSSGGAHDEGDTAHKRRAKARRPQLLGFFSTHYTVVQPPSLLFLAVFSSSRNYFKFLAGQPLHTQACTCYFHFFNVAKGSLSRLKSNFSKQCQNHAAVSLFHFTNCTLVTPWDRPKH